MQTLFIVPSPQQHRSNNYFNFKLSQSSLKRVQQSYSSTFGEDPP